MSANTTEVPESEKVCENLCALFEDPEQWEFERKALMEKIRSIYTQARNALNARPPKVSSSDKGDVKE